MVNFLSKTIDNLLAKSSEDAMKYVKILRHLRPNIPSAYQGCQTFEQMLERYRDQKKKPTAAENATRVESEVVEEQSVNVKELADSINAQLQKPQATKEYTESIDNLEQLFTTRISVQKALNIDPEKIKEFLAQEIAPSPDSRENLLLELNKSTLKWH